MSVSEPIVLDSDDTDDDAPSHAPSNIGMLRALGSGLSDQQLVALLAAYDGDLGAAANAIADGPSSYRHLIAPPVTPAVRPPTSTLPPEETSYARPRKQQHASPPAATAASTAWCVHRGGRWRPYTLCSQLTIECAWRRGEASVDIKEGELLFTLTFDEYEAAATQCGNKRERPVIRTGGASSAPALRAAQQVAELTDTDGVIAFALPLIHAAMRHQVHTHACIHLYEDMYGHARASAYAGVSLIASLPHCLIASLPHCLIARCMCMRRRHADSSMRRGRTGSR